MNLQVGKQQFSFPNATNWFNTNCNNLQMVTLYDTGWVPLAEQVQSFLISAQQNLETNANTVVSCLQQLENYLDSVSSAAREYRMWAYDMADRKHRDRPEGCPRQDKTYSEQAARANLIHIKAGNLKDSVAKAKKAAQAFLDSQGEGGTGYNAELERAISELEGAGKTAETGKKYGQYALIGLGVLVFAFIIIKLRKR